MSNTKKMCYIVVLTALYVVLSAFVKFYIGFGNIQVDLGYIAFAVALCEFGVAGAFVGVVGCALESILFTAYGFSVGWAVANAIIGIGCGLVFMRSKRFFVRVVSIVFFTALGMIVAKTGIECWLYSIPVLVKFPKSIAAFAVDSAVMIVGLAFHKMIGTKIHRR